MKFTLNGAPTDIDAHPMSRLLDVLREQCALTGTLRSCALIKPNVRSLTART